MAEESNGYDWRERMRRIEAAMERNWEEHGTFERNMNALRESMVAQKQNIDNLLGALRDLIDRIPPENLRGK